MEGPNFSRFSVAELICKINPLLIPHFTLLYLLNNSYNLEIHLDLECIIDVQNVFILFYFSLGSAAVFIKQPLALSVRYVWLYRQNPLKLGVHISVLRRPSLLR